MVVSTAVASTSTAHLVPHSSKRTDETEPLLAGASTSRRPQTKKKPFYRARPMWLVPFAIVASVVRGMTIAPRVEVYTQLSCNNLYGHPEWNHKQHKSVRFMTLLAGVDPVGPHIHHLSAQLPSAPQVSSLNETSLPSPLHTTSPTPLDFLIDSSSHLRHLDSDGDGEVDPRRLPSKRCSSDPAVQAGAARLQTIMTTTMGFLSALTTGWWGGFGERHGRTKVLAISTFGLLLTDLTFILVSTPSSVLSKHGHKLLILAPITEGLLGGWSTLQSTTSAYISDCTSPGSRAQIFSRFTGVFYVGFALGPAIGGWLISESGIWASNHERTVTLVFWAAIWCSFINFLLVLLVFPESLNKERRQQRAQEGLERQKVDMKANTKGKQRMVVLPPSALDECEVGTDIVVGNIEEDPQSAASSSNTISASQVDGSTTLGTDGGFISHFLRPLAVFLPAVVHEPSWTGVGFKKRTDWSLTMLAMALFGLMLSTGVYQIKYLYAVHTYSWGAEKLGYYISLMGGLRAVFLLFLLPTIIGFFKPKPSAKGKAAATKASGASQPAMISNGPNMSLAHISTKAKPTRAQLGNEITFDLMLTRLSLMVDIIGHTLVACIPAPTIRSHHRMVQNLSAGPSRDGHGESLVHELGKRSAGLSTRSEAAFVLASAMNGFGAGSVPAIHSLALCLMQLRVLGRESMSKGVGSGMKDASAMSKTDEKVPGVLETGELLGALAVLQAAGQMILGPMLFGLVYSGTVAEFPKTVFIVAAAICFLSLLLVFGVRNPVRLPKGSSSSKAKPVMRRRRDGVWIERGRPRASKDLRGGAIPYYIIPSSSSSSYGSTSSNSVDAAQQV